MKRWRRKSVWVDILFEILGSFLIGLALYNLALPAGFPMTGFSGTAMIVNRFTGAPIGLVTLVLNIPVILLCLRLIGWRFLLRSFRCMLLSTFFLDVVSPLLPQYEGERLLAAILTGVIGGAGYAMIYTRNSSTGGYGLGMSIAHSIVTVHKGKIRAESPAENVLTIAVTLPQ